MTCSAFPLGGSGDVADARAAAAATAIAPHMNHMIYSTIPKYIVVSFYDGSLVLLSVGCTCTFYGAGAYYAAEWVGSMFNQLEQSNY